MTKFLFKNSGLRSMIKTYAKMIEDKTNLKINYNEKENYYYYEINDLNILIEIIEILDIGIIIDKNTFDKDLYEIEVYDDWRE